MEWAIILVVCVYSWSPASSVRRVRQGPATVVDSMRESIHAVRCDFLQGIYTERADQVANAIMHIGFFACFHGISLERSRFRKNTLFFQARVVLKLLVSLIGL